VDMKMPSGDQVPIEERSSEEMTHVDGVRISPQGVPVINPAFDVTPAELVTALITEVGVLYPPFEVSLQKAKAECNNGAKEHA